MPVDHVLPSGHPGSSFPVQRFRPDRTWWVFAPNPFVVLADAAPVAPRPIPPPGITYAPDPVDPLGGISNSVRQLRVPPDGGDAQPPASSDRGPLVWPTGLAIDLVLGGLALWLTIRRLRTPSRKLPRGQRVA